MKIDKKNVYKIILIIIVFFVCIPAFRLFDHFVVNDLNFHIKRVDGLVQAINNFDFPYRINNVGNISYGSADPIMYPYLTIYIVAFLYKIFNDYNIAFNIFYIIVNIFTAIIMYYSTYELFLNKKVALFSTLMLMLSFYRMWEIYIGACVGQYLAVMFLPLVVEGYVNVLKGRYDKWIDILIGFTLSFHSHILTAFYTGVVLVVLSILFIKKIFSDRKKLIALVKVVIFFVLINLWYIVPFMQYYLSGKILTPRIGFPWKMASKLSFVDNIILLCKITINNMCFNIFDEPRVHMRVSYMTLFLLIIVLVFCIQKLINNRKKSKIDKHIYTFDEKVVIIFLIIFLFDLIVSTGIFTRTFLGGVSVIQKFFALQQFENREIARGQVLFFMACGYIIEKYVNHKKIIKFLVVFAGIFSLVGLYMAIFSSSKVYDNCYDFVNSDYMLLGTLDGDIRDKIKLEYKYVLPKDIFDNEVRVDNDGIYISDEKKVYNGYNLSYRIKDGSEHTIEIPLYNYDGYVVYDGKKKIRQRTGENALISIVPKNKSGNIKVRFEEKILWKICDALSLIVLIGLIVWRSIIYARYNNKQKIVL